jgi:excisionase family DNA binding protein
VILDHLPCVACGTPLSTDALDNDGCTVEGCNAELSDDDRAQLEMARAVENAISAMRSATPAEREHRRNTAAGLLSARTAARRLGIGRDTLARLVQVGEIKPVPKGARSGFRAVDVEALIERGYTLPDRDRPTPKKTRRRSKENGAAPVQRISDLPY